MCVGIPMQLVSVNGLEAHATDGFNYYTIDLMLIGPQFAGTWVLSFLGCVREVLTEANALKIQEAVRALQNIMSGNDTLHDAFADLETRGPQLPSHLQTVLDAGETTG